MKNAPVIIVKKKKGHGHGHHGGAWKVAYADFVTAMMAFFLVLWIVGQSRPVKAGVAGYFRDPGVLENSRSNGILPGGNEGVSPNAPPNLQSSTGKGKSDQPSPDAQAALRHAGELLRERLARMPELAKLQKQVEIQLTRDGLRIELIETSDSLFFDTGSAALKSRDDQAARRHRDRARVAAELDRDRRAQRQPPLLHVGRLLQLGAVVGPRQRRAPCDGAGRAAPRPGERSARVCEHAASRADRSARSQEQARLDHRVEHGRRPFGAGWRTASSHDRQSRHRTARRQCPGCCR